MDRLNRLLGQGAFGGLGGGQAAQSGDTPQVDNSEIIYISPLSLLKVSNPQGSSLMLDAKACSGWSANGSNGSYARRVCR